MINRNLVGGLDYITRTEPCPLCLSDVIPIDVDGISSDVDCEACLEYYLAINPPQAWRSIRITASILSEENNLLRGLLSKSKQRVEELEEELRWYGHAIAGAGPIRGYKISAKEAEERWYTTTLKLLEAKALLEQARADQPSRKAVANERRG